MTECETHHKACFSNLAITQYTDFQSNQVRIRIGTVPTKGQVVGLQTQLHSLHRRTRIPARQAAVPTRPPDGASKDPVPDEPEELPENRHPLENAPLDLDVDDSPAELRHLPGGFMNDFGHGFIWSWPSWVCFGFVGFCGAFSMTRRLEGEVIGNSGGG